MACVAGMVDWLECCSVHQKVEGSLTNSVRSQDSGFSWGCRVVTRKGHAGASGHVLFLDLGLITHVHSL